MNEAEIKARLIPLYQQMADLTRPECGKCLIPYHCCDAGYCNIAIDSAKERWGISLPITDHPRLPLMGPTGCTAAPHMRSMCTAHTCEMNKFGCKSGDPAWTEKYYELHEQINTLEFDLLLIEEASGKGVV